MTIDVARCSHGIVCQNNLCALKLYTIGRTQVIRIFAQGMLYVQFKCKQLFVQRINTNYELPLRRVMHSLKSASKTTTSRNRSRSESAPLLEFRSLLLRELFLLSDASPISIAEQDPLNRTQHTFRVTFTTADLNCCTNSRVKISFQDLFQAWSKSLSSFQF